ncbi:unnamed protein product, partial [Prorocentrum cordatum]
EAHEMLTLVTTTETKVEDQHRERTHWEPWTLVRRDLALEGFTNPKDQQLEFRRRCMSREYTVKPDPRRPGGYLIAEYQGEIDDAVLTKGTTASLTKSSSSSLTGTELDTALQSMASNVGAALTAVQESQRASHGQGEDRDHVAVPEDFLESVYRGTLDCAPQLHGALGSFIEDQTTRAEKEKVLAHMEALEDIEAKNLAKDAAAAKVNPVTVRLGTLQLADRLQSSLVSALENQVSEGINVLEYMKSKISATDLDGEPWKPFKDKLEALSTAAQDEINNVKARISKLCAHIDSPAWDLSVAGVKEAFKKIAAEQKKDCCHQVLTAKMLQNCRSLLAKAASGGASSKKRKAGERAEILDIGETQDYRPALTMVKATIHDAPVGVMNSLCNLDFQNACLIDVKASLGPLLSSADWKPLAKWCKEKVMSWESDGAAPAFGAVSQPGILMMLRGLVKDEANGQTIFRSAFVPVTPKDQALHKHIFGVQIYTIPAGHCSAGPSSYGLSEVRVVTGGEEVVVGVKAKQEHSLAETVGFLKSLPGAGLLQLAREQGNFAMVIREGSLAVLPAGFVYLTFRPVPCQGMRWGFCAGWQGELSTCRMSVASVMEAHSAVKGSPYETWWDKLAELGDR